MRLAKALPLLLSLSAACLGQTQFPDTPAGHQGTAWLQSFNSGDRDAYLAFLEKNLPARAKNIEQEMNFRKMTGGFDLKKVEEASTLTKTHRSRTGA